MQLNTNTIIFFQKCFVLLCDLEKKSQELREVYSFSVMTGQIQQFKHWITQIYRFISKFSKKSFYTIITFLEIQIPFPNLCQRCCITAVRISSGRLSLSTYLKFIFCYMHCSRAEAGPCQMLRNICHASLYLPVGQAYRESCSRPTDLSSYRHGLKTSH